MGFNLAHKYFFLNVQTLDPIILLIFKAKNFIFILKKILKKRIAFIKKKSIGLEFDFLSGPLTKTFFMDTFISIFVFTRIFFFQFFMLLICCAFKIVFFFYFFLMFYDICKYARFFILLNTLNYDYFIGK